MAVLEFGPLSPPNNVDKNHVVNFLVGPLNIVWWGRRGIWVEEGVQATCTLFQKHGLKLALAVRKTTTKIDRPSQLSFSMIVGSEI